MNQKTNLALRKKTVKELDTTLSLLVRTKNPHCVICGSSENLTCGHLFSRVAYSTRWDLQNTETQCMGCNLRHEFDPYIFYTWYKNKYGEKQFDELHRRYITPHKLTTNQLIEILNELKVLLKIAQNTAP
jgi:hypothetical protein